MAEENQLKNPARNHWISGLEAQGEDVVSQDTHSVRKLPNPGV
jgi:hypothetical protein